jgi:RHS repeat-associated protein
MTTMTTRSPGRVRACFLSAVVLLAAAVTPAVGQTVEYYHLDALGSVRAVTDQSGTVIRQHNYFPFGEGDGTTAGTAAQRFTGKERDAETGLDYFGARYYASRTGRFTTVDPVMPIEDALLDPQRWNRYSYVMNRPLVLTDPDGRCPQCFHFLQRLASTPAVQRAQQVVATQGARAWVALTRLFNTPAGQETLKTAAELATGADAGPTALPTIDLAGKAAARAALAELGDVGVAANRFFRDATSKSTDFTITELAGGVRRLQFFSPANNPGYGKRYLQEIDEFGRIVREYKETIGPEGVIEIKWVHGGPGQ